MTSFMTVVSLKMLHLVVYVDFLVNLYACNFSIRNIKNTKHYNQLSIENSRIVHCSRAIELEIDNINDHLIIIQYFIVVQIIFADDVY